MDKINWGILGAARIAANRVIPAIQKSQHGVVAAMASRDIDKARQMAARFQIPKAYGSYDDLLADPHIDAVYIPLPNHLHVPYALKAMAAGKHALVEKPIALNAAEAEQLHQAALQHPQIKVMEAFMYRFHPQWQIVHAMLRDGVLGELHAVHGYFFYHNTDPNNIRQKPEMGGGGLLDIGCYPISAARWLFAAEPRRVLGWLQFDPLFQTDRLASGMLEFAGGIATFQCGTQTAYAHGLTLFGSRGSLRVETPFAPPTDQPALLRHYHDNHFDEIPSPIADQFSEQCDQFAQAILQDQPVPTPLSDAVANMRVIDAIFTSASRNEWTLIN